MHSRLGLQKYARTEHEHASNLPITICPIKKSKKTELLKPHKLNFFTFTNAVWPTNWCQLYWKELWMLRQTEQNPKLSLIINHNQLRTIPKPGSRTKQWKSLKSFHEMSKILSRFNFISKPFFSLILFPLPTMKKYTKNTHKNSSEYSN